MNRIDLYGLSWETRASHAPPTIYGDVRRDNDAIVAVQVGVTARQTNPRANAWTVTVEQDAVLVPRLPSEPFYSGLALSLVQRVASLHGTSRPWSLVYG